MILKLLLNTQTTWITFKRILKKTIQIKKRIILIVLNDAIVDMLSNKTLNPIVLNYLLEEIN